MTLAEVRERYFRAHIRVDRIIEKYSDRDYLELITVTGGDVATYRVYGDGVNKEFFIGQR